LHILDDLSCQSGAFAATIAKVNNSEVQSDVRGSSQPPAAPSGSPFLPGVMVILTLGNPREKFWGAILAVALEGLSLSGIDLSSLDDCVAMVKDGEPFSPGVVFFPMHRVERMELDLPGAGLPSLAQRFAAKTGIDPAVALSPSHLDARQERP